MRTDMRGFRSRLWTTESLLASQVRSIQQMLELERKQASPNNYRHSNAHVITVALMTCQNKLATNLSWKGIQWRE